jgi:hypothetical protein
MSGRSLFSWARAKRALVVFIALFAPVVLPLERATSAQVASTSSVRSWNAHALTALTNPLTAPVPGAMQTPPVSALHMAMVQGAVYDAVNSIDGSHEPYLEGLPPADAAASLDAAVATAAHHVLVGLGIAPVPPLPQAVRDRLDALYAESLAAIVDGPAEDDGIAAGAAAAAAMLAERTGDGRYVPHAFPVGSEPGQWRPAPPAFVNDPFAWVAKVDPFVLDEPSQFRTQGPRHLSSGAYAKEYDEVKALGAAENSSRNSQQEAIAQFYTNSPVELFNRTFRSISGSEGLTVVEEARLFGMLNLATADALINCWDDKEHFRFWRPITAIHEGDNDGNRFTVGDPTWAPLQGTPPYPDHSSGYNCATGAMMHTGRAFFGTNDMSFDVVRLPSAPDVKRHYEQFTAVIDDTIEARVLQGLHFRSADVQGARIGRDVARLLSTKFLR